MNSVAFSEGKRASRTIRKALSGARSVYLSILKEDKNNNPRSFFNNVLNLMRNNNEEHADHENVTAMTL